MRRLLFVLLLVSCCFIINKGYAQGTFQKTLNLNGGDTINHVITLKEGGYMIAAVSPNPSGNINNSFLIKLNAAYQIVWSKEISSDGGLSINKFIETSDGSFVASGTYTHHGDGRSDKDLLIMKFDANGTVLWSKNYGGTKDDIGSGITEAPGEGYVAAGQTNSFGSGGLDYYCIKTDYNGNLLWAKTYGGGHGDYAIDVIATPDKGFMLTGATLNWGGGQTYYSMVIKIDDNGNIQWSKAYGGNSGDDILGYLQAAADGGYYLSDATASWGLGTTNIFLCKIKADGTLEWAKVYSMVGEALRGRIYKLPDEGLIMAVRNADQSSKDYVYLLRLDKDGNIIWQKKYNTPNNALLNYVVPTADQGFMAVGTAGGDAFIIKTDANGNTPDCKEEDVNFSVLPENPNVATASPVSSNQQDGTAINLKPPTSPSLKFHNYCINLSPPVANFGFKDSVCVGDYVAFTDSTLNDPTNWKWTFNGAADSLHSVLQNPQHILFNKKGTYDIQLTAKNSLGQDAITKQITVVQPPSVNLGNDTSICEGTAINIKLDATNPPPADYQWQDNSTNPTFQVNAAGTYFVNVNNFCGADMDTLHVYQLKAPEAFNLPDTTLCQGTAYHFESKDTTSTVKYSWSDGSTSAVHDINTAGKFWLTTSNSCGTQSDTGFLTYVSPPVVKLRSDTALCEGAPINITLDATNPSPATYQWQDNSSNPTFHVSSPGKYTVNANNICGSAADTFNLYQLKAPIAFNLPDTSICEGTAFHFVSQDTSSNVQYHWSDGNTSSVHDVNTAGKFWLTTSNSCGSKSDTGFLSFIAAPTVNLGADTAICNDQQIDITLDATNPPPADYLWQDGSTNSQYHVTQPGTYSVKVTNKCGSISDDYTVSTIAPPPSFNLPDTALCDVQQVTIQVSSLGQSYNYLWNDGDTMKEHMISQGGDYWLQASNQCGMSSDTGNIQFGTSPVADLGQDTTICRDNTIVLFNHSGTAQTYLWQDGSSGHTYTVNAPGIYSLKLSNDFCSSTDSVFVNPCDLNDCFYLPNAFTPNHDGTNDYFRISHPSCIITSFDMKIFNRWGKIVFESKDMNSGWDGIYNHELQPVGAYVYIIKYNIRTSKGNIPLQKTGSITLIK